VRAGGAVMSAPMMSAALRTPGLAPSERLVYVYLCDRANGEMVCWPTADTIAADLELSRRAVLGGITKLRRMSLIETQMRYKQSSIYRILPTKTPPRAQSPNGAESAPEADWDVSRFDATVAPEVCDADIAPEPGVQKTASGVQNPAFSGAKSCDSGVQNLHTESPIESSNESPTESPIPRARKKSRGCVTAVPEAWLIAFAAFYAAYPNKKAPERARRAFFACLRKGVTPAEIMAGLDRFVFDDRPRFRPHPATWLNDARWRDEPTDTFDPALRAAGITPEMLARARQPTHQPPLLLAVAGGRR
jgi:hypothetical protein